MTIKFSKKSYKALSEGIKSWNPY